MKNKKLKPERATLKGLTEAQQVRLEQVIKDTKEEINYHFTVKGGDGGWPLDFLLYKSEIINRTFPGLEGAIVGEFLGENKNKHFKLVFNVNGKNGARDLPMALIKKKNGKGKKSGKKTK